MDTREAGLHPLAVGVIFFLVFALMYNGLPLSLAEFAPRDTTTDAEDRLADAVWAELNDRRTASGLSTMPSDRFAGGVAQDTTDALAAAAGPGDPGAAVRNVSLTNHRLECTQIPVGVTRDPEASTAETAARIADAFAATDRQPVFDRPKTRFRAGLGVAVEGDRAFAVYRSCEHVDT